MLKRRYFTVAKIFQLLNEKQILFHRFCRAFRPCINMNPTKATISYLKIIPIPCLIETMYLPVI